MSAQHHVWCNYWNRPAETCDQCKRLRERYPYDENKPEMQAAEELTAEHFPDVQILKPAPSEIADHADKLRQEICESMTLPPELLESLGNCRSPWEQTIHYLRWKRETGL